MSDRLVAWVLVVHPIGNTVSDTASPLSPLARHQRRPAGKGWPGQRQGQAEGQEEEEGQKEEGEEKGKGQGSVSAG